MYTNVLKHITQACVPTGKPSPQRCTKREVKREIVFSFMVWRCDLIVANRFQRPPMNMWGVCHCYSRLMVYVLRVLFLRTRTRTRIGNAVFLCVY